MRSRGAKPQIREYAALEYSNSFESFVYYSAGDGPVIYAIDWDREARWHVISEPEGLDPISDAAAQSHYPVNRGQTFGRFRLVQFDTVELALLVRHIDSPVYCLRFPS